MSINNLYTDDLIALARTGDEKAHDVIVARVAKGVKASNMRKFQAYLDGASQEQAIEQAVATPKPKKAQDPNVPLRAMAWTACLNLKAYPESALSYKACCEVLGTFPARSAK